ncbi:MAG: allophanate hydrolase [Cyclobacteriaceae bacterium]|nr:MAG: allophanate hydrolase [Cyclobacteriaceae bacterium]
MGISVMPLGDQAVVVNFEQQINPVIHQKVLDLSRQIEQKKVEGINFISPAYCSITIGYDPVKIPYSRLGKLVKELSTQPVVSGKTHARKVTIPVCYHEKFALDLEEVSRLSGLSKKEIIVIHTDEIYRVYMLGFLPGFPYLGVLPESLQLPRKAKPVLRIPERSIAIAGKQTGIYPAESPGGWYVVGRTPMPLLRKNPLNNFVLRPGDEVKFRSISLSVYQELILKVKEQIFDWDSIYE